MQGKVVLPQECAAIEVLPARSAWLSPQARSAGEAWVEKCLLKPLPGPPSWGRAGGDCVPVGSALRYSRLHHTGGPRGLGPCAARRRGSSHRRPRPPHRRESHQDRGRRGQPSRRARQQGHPEQRRSVVHHRRTYSQREARSRARRQHTPMSPKLSTTRQKTSHRKCVRCMR